jgi:[acyl-carrier-protein] S-malonyltransferase
MGPGSAAGTAEFMTTDPAARRLASMAGDILHYDLARRLRESPDDYSEAAQVGFLINCLALAEWAEESMGMRPGYCVGPSFGSRPASVYVGALPADRAIRMTAQLARCVRAYFAQAHRDVVTHSFVRAGEHRLAVLLAELDDRGEWYEVSGELDRDFFFLTLRERNLEWLQRRLRQLGALSLHTMRPPVHAAAFGPLRARAAQDVLAGLGFATPRIPLLADHDASLVSSADGVRDLLLDGFVKPLRWPLVIETLHGLGVRRVFVTGPDRLFGRVRATTAAMAVVAVDAGRAGGRHTIGRTLASSE